MSRVAIVLALALAACGFTPTTLGADQAAAAHEHDAPAMGSGSGSGSGAACPDGDDDLDGICNSVDDWQCGQKPADLADQNGGITLQGTWGSDHLTLNGNDTRLVSVHTNEAFTIAFDFDLYEPCTITTTCRIELEIGTDMAGKSGCVWDGGVVGGAASIAHKSGPWSGALSYTQGGIYEVRVMPVFAGSCTTNWAGIPPDGNKTIARVCVH